MSSERSEMERMIRLETQRSSTKRGSSCKVGEEALASGPVLNPVGKKVTLRFFLTEEFSHLYCNNKVYTVVLKRDSAAF